MIQGYEENLKMTNIPFPPTLVTISSNSATKRQSESAHTSIGTFPRSHMAESCAAYRLPNGVVRPAYNPYKPEYPKNSTPGLARIMYSEKFYANETRGYEATVLDFSDMEALVSKGLSIDMTAAAIVTCNDDLKLVIGDNEQDLEEQINLMGEISSVDRAVIQSRNESSDILQHFFAVKATAGVELNAATTEDGLFSILRERYSFLAGNSQNLSDIVQAIEDKSQGSDVTWKSIYKERNMTVDLGLSM